MKKLLLLLFVTFISFSLKAQTTVPGGDINSGTWTSAGSPYEITGNITLPSGNTLTIEPDVDVVFQNDYSFTIEGNLLAVGTEVDSIWFYPSDTTIGWQGLRFIDQNSNGQDSSKLIYCKIKYGNADGSGEDVKGGGIYCNNSSELLINNSEVSHNLADIGGGIYCDASSHPLIVATIIELNHANYGGGIYGNNSNFQLNSSFVKNNQAIVNGGGIYFSGGTPTLTSDTISNNVADEGGGLYPNGSNITIYYSSINSNTALINGGGMFQLSSTCNIFDSEISFNISLNESPGSGGYPGGGGIYIRNQSISLTRVSIEGNSTNEGGGGIHCQKATINADSLEVVNNVAGSVGGGIYSHDHDNITFLNSQFISNQSDKGGGVYTSQFSDSYFENIIFFDNDAADYGGGASFAESDSHFINSEFRNDTANLGGAISLYLNSTVIIEHTLISYNHASDNGGGVFFRNSVGSTANFENVTISKNTAVNQGNAIYSNASDNMTIKNTIIWDHSSPALSGAGTITATYSDIEGGFAGTGNMDIDPQFTDPNNGDFTLAWENYPETWGIKSPCIDTGDPGSPTDPDGTIADMGAFYFHQTTTPISGSINGTLKCSESPYLVMGDLTVASGDELVIEPCVHLIFMGDYKLEVEGRLVAIGNAADSISFYPDDTLVGWHGVRLLNQNSNGQDSSKMKFCTVEYSNANGITCNQSALKIENCLIKKNTSNGIYIVVWSGLTLDNTMLIYNKGEGLCINYYSNLNATNTTTKDNLINGISILMSSDAVLNDFNSTGNGGAGVFVGYHSSLQFSEGAVSNNLDGGILVDDFYNDITLEDLVIQGNETAGNGGGIFIEGNEFVNAIFFGHNLLIDDNTATSGGGIYIKSSTITLDNTTISNNRGNADGGGIFADNSNMNLQNIDINGNTAASQRGGGIYCRGSQLQIDSVDFENNQSHSSGGAIYSIDSAQLNILNSEFNQNISTNYDGGAMNCNNSICSLKNVNINNCQALNGGGLVGTFSNYDLTNVSINNCSASQSGGGIKIGGASSEIVMDHVLIAGNSSGSDGGGLHFQIDLEASLNHVTIINNTSGGGGEAIYANSQVDLKNCIVWDHLSPAFAGSGVITATYSDIQDSLYPGTGNIDEDPMFMYPDDGIYNLSWLNYPVEDNTKSPCINTGDPSSPLDPDGTRADMGAFPFVAYQFSPEITSINDVPNDQGKQVVINWNKSELDNAEHAIIEKYTIWRQQNWAKIPWEYIGETPAHFYDEYAYIAPTISDSTAAGVPYYTYLVSAETANPYAFYNSLADSGYSVDNLAPEPPSGFYAFQEDSLIKLFWDQSLEDDFDYFALYKSNDPENFSSEPYVTLSETMFDDPDFSSDTLYYKLTAFDFNGNESESSDTLEIITGKNLNLKVFLEGPFFITQMIPYLNLGGYIPLAQPYYQPPWNYSGEEAVDQIPNSDIVDWVLLEFRDATDPASAVGSAAIYKTAAFLKGDGTIVGLDGMSPPKINVDYSQNLYLVVWHRNHIGILSALPVEETEGSLAYDFTDSPDKIWGGEKSSKLLNNGIWGMMSADGNADGNIDNKDKNDIWDLQRSLSGYLQGDFDMNSEVEYNDKLLWEENVGKSSFVPE